MNAKDTPPNAVRMNIERMVNDLGGVAELTNKIGVVRTAPYRWIKSGYISNRVLEKIKTAYPLIDLNQYFERDTH